MYQVTYNAPECLYGLAVDEFDTERDAQEWAEHIHQTRHVDVQLTDFKYTWILTKGEWI